MDNVYIFLYLCALQGGLLNAVSDSIISFLRNRFVIDKTAQFVLQLSLENSAKFFPRFDYFRFATVVFLFFTEQGCQP
jgi:hypothetical protein